MGASLPPHGGELRNLLLDGDAAGAARLEACELPAWELGGRRLCDLELLLNGAFSPLTGYLNREDYEHVLADLRLESGILWPIPVTLDVEAAFATGLGPGARVALRDPEGVPLAILGVESVWTPDKRAEAQAVYGTTDDAHPGVSALYHRTGDVYLGGRLEGIESPAHHDFKWLRDTPAELRARFSKLGWRRVLAFLTARPMHRAEVELTHRAAVEQEANLLLHAVVGPGRPGDVDHFTRVRCYEHVLKRYPEKSAQLSLLELALRPAGPRAALWHGILARNHGCTHLLVGRDDSGAGHHPSGRAYYGPHDAQRLFEDHQDELGVGLVEYPELVRVEGRAGYVPAAAVEPGTRVLKLAGHDLRRRLEEGRELPEWFTYPEVAEELRRVCPPRRRQGFTVFFTGLSGAGKSAIASALCARLLELGGRRVTLLDGDLVRKHLSSELGYSRADRDRNVLRIGWVAAQITRHGGVAICAPIAPYLATRRRVREMIEPHGGFLEIHVATPLETCERRDRKGLYAQARAGRIENFTGVSDPYEEPEDPDMRIDTDDLTPALAAQRILVQLESRGYLG